MSLLISETFTSLQGEGKLTGVPTWFVRLSGCNMRCAWCDTPYASWNPEGTKRTIDELADEAHKSGVRHAVVTGGEPMIFKELPELCAKLRDKGMHITIETAGTVYPDEWKNLACDLMSISPKLANSTPSRTDERDPLGVWHDRHEERRLNLDVLRRLAADSADIQMKFVVSSPSDLPEIERLLSELPGVRAGDVMLMPEGTKPPEPGTTDWVVRACIERGWRYCRRLHIDLFGDTRGT